MVKRSRKRAQRALRRHFDSLGQKGEGGCQKFAQTKYQSTEGHFGEHGQSDLQDQMERGAKALVQRSLFHSGHRSAKHGQRRRIDRIRRSHQSVGEGSHRRCGEKKTAGEKTREEKQGRISFFDGRVANTRKSDTDVSVG